MKTQSLKSYRTPIGTALHAFCALVERWRETSPSGTHYSEQILTRTSDPTRHWIQIGHPPIHPITGEDEIMQTRVLNGISCNTIEQVPDGLQRQTDRPDTRADSCCCWHWADAKNKPTSIGRPSIRRTATQHESATSPSAIRS